MILEVHSRSLLAILLFTPWICSSFGSLSPGMENPIHQVKGILGGSVLFPAKISQGIAVEKMGWDFCPESGALGFWLGEFSHGKLEHPSPTDRFGQRLDMVDETTLRIKDLELDDGGIYNARIWITKSQFQEQSFSLTVYEPVPELQILPRDVSNSSGICNVTLQCQVCGKGEFDISWKRGEPLRDIGDGLDWYQISDNGTNLHLLWWSNAGDSNFTCLVRNPIGQKDVSFSLLSICQTDDEGTLTGSQQRLRWMICLPIGFIATLTCSVMIWKRKYIFKKRDCLHNAREPALSFITTVKEEPPQSSS
nr:V-set and immunoglobulin domain-containing protein 10-like isoform X2 [Zootoca vivipara]XP_034958510.1 V-set and immunoglobulin domain-containing protein 10-like isoform X2 [Zootoca vivipara]